jgi:hypothetical protein
MAERQSRCEMLLSWFIPVILMCAFEPNEIHHCDEHTEKVQRYELAPIQKFKIIENQPEIEVPITTPMLCLAAGTTKLVEEFDAFQKANPKKDIEFRIVCRHEKA